MLGNDFNSNNLRIIFWQNCETLDSRHMAIIIDVENVDWLDTFDTTLQKKVLFCWKIPGLKLLIKINECTHRVVKTNDWRQKWKNEW